MSKLTLPPHEKAFLRQHKACDAAMDWLEDGQYPSLDAAWQVCQRGDWMIWLLYEADDLDDATWRHLAVDFAEQVRHLMTDKRSLDALAVARRYANGQATRDELAAARAAAWAAAWAAARDAARAAAWAAAWDAARAAAWDAAWAAAWDAARDAAWAAAGDAAWAAAGAAAGDAARDAAWAAAGDAAWAAAGAAAGAAQANLIRARVPHAPTIANAD